jgi:hypothetical protein
VISISMGLSPVTLTSLITAPESVRLKTILWSPTVTLDSLPGAVGTNVFIKESSGIDRGLRQLRQ